MNGLALAGVLGAVAGSACAQATHRFEVFMVGPDVVLPGSTFTMEVWGRVDSPAFVDGVSRQWRASAST